MGLVCGKGVNDMPYGWAKENEWNKKVYRKWCSMLCRCYSEKYHKRQPSYVGCLVSDKWLSLSNFVEDFSKIDGYDEEKFLNGYLCLDKDIKSNGANKEYSLENCMFVSKIENSKQAAKTRNNDYLHHNPMCGKHHSEETKKKLSEANSIKIAQYNKQGKLIKIWCSSIEIQRTLEISASSIIVCCKWYACGEDLEEWYKTHKNHPYKSAGGYIWKYYYKE